MLLCCFQWYFSQGVRPVHCWVVDERCLSGASWERISQSVPNICSTYKKPCQLVLGWPPRLQGDRFLYKQRQHLQPRRWCVGRPRGRNKFLSRRPRSGEWRVSCEARRMLNSSSVTRKVGDGIFGYWRSRQGRYLWRIIAFFELPQCITGDANWQVIFLSPVSTIQFLMLV